MLLRENLVLGIRIPSDYSDRMNQFYSENFSSKKASDTLYTLYSSGIKLHPLNLGCSLSYYLQVASK